MDCSNREYLKDRNQHFDIRRFCPAGAFASPRGWTIYPHFASRANRASGYSPAVAGLTQAWDPFAIYRTPESHQSASDVRNSLPLASEPVNKFLSVGRGRGTNLD
jgi:hypothetical protein